MAVVKVSNVSRLVTEEILHQLFSLIGPVSRLTLQTESGDSQDATVEFADPASTAPALHLSGVELGDRALYVTEESPQQPRTSSIHTLPLANAAAVAQLARRPPHASLPASIAAHIPPSILHTDPVKAEEISRTIYVGNIPCMVGDQELMDFFSACGPVAYVKMAGDGVQPMRFAFVEFVDVDVALRALQMNGAVLRDRALKVNRSKNAINKPGGAPALLGLAGAATMAKVQPMVTGVRQAGVAWPVLGNQQHDELELKINQIRDELELKYKDQIPSKRT
ncbi:hypothetical protein H4R23_003677 [Coemansia sp. Cherry 401B]|nr:hypothetical protein H4R23_003677 [Coemansia sp. Cherry 401B]